LCAEGCAPPGRFGAPSGSTPWALACGAQGRIGQHRADRVAKGHAQGRAEIDEQLVPHDLADIGGGRREHADLLQNPAQAIKPRTCAPAGLAQDEHVAIGGVHPGLDHVVRRVNDRADHPLGRHRARQPAVGIKARELRGRLRPGGREPLRVPPGNAVLHEHEQRIRPRKRRRRLGKRAQPGRFCRDKHHILRSEVGRPVARPHTPRKRALAMPQCNAAGAQRVEIGPARHGRHVVPRRRQLRGEVAADRARAEHAYPHSADFDGVCLSCIIRPAGFLNELPLDRVQLPNVFLIDGAGNRALAWFIFL
jgi:hypothetical protein